MGQRFACHAPRDVAKHIEWAEPHTELWFNIVDSAEPRLGVLARVSIEREGSADVCSSCGASSSDFLLINATEAMPTVPSLRLCPDCVAIRRGFGEKLEPIV